MLNIFEILTFLLWFLAAYFITANILFLIQIILAFKLVASEKKQARELPAAFLQAAKPKLSVLIPCFNEAKVIVNNAQSILRNSYPNLEVIIINDGSTDQTLSLLQSVFALGPGESHGSFRVHRSEKFKNLIVIDQDNFGKSVSLNHALQITSGALVATIDADTYVVEDALLKCVYYMSENPDCMVLGGIVRVSNGAQSVNGEVTQGRLPRAFLPLFQTIEYIRSFFGGRLGWEALGGSALVPGAFSLFRKEALSVVGGFDPTSPTEDFEIVIRLKQEFAKKNIPCEIHMISWPVCWTEVPDRLSDLFYQRVRWQRGLLQTLRKHRGLIGSGAAGRTGLLTLPYMLIFEGLAPLLELIGYIVVPLAYFNHMISPESLRLFLVLGIAYYSLLTVVTIHLEEKYYARHFSIKSFFIFLLYSILENFGYRQFIFVARLKGTLGIFSGKGFWGAHERGSNENVKHLNQTENLGLLVVAVCVLAIGLFTLRTDSAAEGSKVQELQSLIQSRDAEYARGNFEKALADTEKLHVIAPNNAVYLTQLANLREKQGQFESAALAWEQYLTISSSYEDACPVMGRNYLAAGLKEKAFAALQLCYKMLPQNTDVIYFLAREHESRQEYDRAFELYRQGLDLAPGYTDMAEGLARVAPKRNKKNE